MGKDNHPMNAFARHKKSGHPNWIYEKHGNFYKHIGITHDSDDGKNIPLEKNPEPGNDSQAYIKPNPEESRKENFKETYSGWKFADEDKQKVKKVQKKPIVKTGK